jgi:hypothetical protein
MAVNRREAIALAAAGLFAIATPLWLLQPATLPPAIVASSAPLPIRAASTAPLTAIYARPLFGGANTTDDPSDLPSDAPQLVGVVGRIGSDAVAMVKSGDGASRTLQVGESVNGWTLESLAIDAAFFTRGGQRVRVPLPAG